MDTEDAAAIVVVIGTGLGFTVGDSDTIKGEGVVDQTESTAAAGAIDVFGLVGEEGVGLFGEIAATEGDVADNPVTSDTPSGEQALGGGDTASVEQGGGSAGTEEAETGFVEEEGESFGVALICAGGDMDVAAGSGYGEGVGDGPEGGFG